MYGSLVYPFAPPDAIIRGFENLSKRYLSPLAPQMLSFVLFCQKETSYLSGISADLFLYQEARSVFLGDPTYGAFCKHDRWDRQIFLSCWEQLRGWVIRRASGRVNDMDEFRKANLFPLFVLHFYLLAYGYEGSDYLFLSLEKKDFHLQHKTRGVVIDSFLYAIASIRTRRIYQI